MKHNKLKATNYILVQRDGYLNYRNKKKRDNETSGCNGHGNICEYEAFYHA